MLRCTGKVVRIDHRAGSKANQETGEMRDWSMHIIKVLVADQAIVEVTRFGDHSTPLPVVGAAVDYAVEVSPRGQRLNIALDKPWGELFPPLAVVKAS